MKKEIVTRSINKTRVGLFITALACSGLVYTLYTPNSTRVHANDTLNSTRVEKLSHDLRRQRDVNAKLSHDLLNYRTRVIKLSHELQNYRNVNAKLTEKLSHTSNFYLITRYRKVKK